ncbi:MAG: YwaF family protein [Clostridia bacterium]|nr:YwaF family protein [Clostridia bacterium]
MNPQLWGKEHLIYIAVSIAVAFSVCFFAKRYAGSEKAQQAVIKISAGLLFAIILTNRLALVFEYDNARWNELIPDSFCSASSYVLSLALLLGKKNNNVLHFIWLVALAGGTITTFYPDFIGQHPSFLYPPTILGMVHHTWSAIVVVLVFLFGWLKLTYKKWYYTLFGFAAYLSLGAFLMCVLDYGNPFYMKEPAIGGTPFTVWVIAPIYIAVYSVILLTVELVRRHAEKKDIRR